MKRSFKKTKDPQRLPIRLAYMEDHREILFVRQGQLPDKPEDLPQPMLLAPGQMKIKPRLSDRSDPIVFGVFLYLRRYWG